MPGRIHQVVFDYKGERVLFARNDRLTVWDLARNQVLKLLNVELGYGGVTATLSPDGRWLAAAVGTRDASVVAWDLNLPDTAEPARSLDAVCNLEESNCIRRLCDKISTALDERQLRSLSAMRPLTSLTARSEQPVVDASGRVLAAPIPAKAPAKSFRRASPSQPMRCRARSDLLSPYMRGK